MPRKKAEVEEALPEPRFGLFVRDVLKEEKELSASEIHQAYKRTFKEAKNLKGRSYRLGTYRSHLVYVRSLERMGMIRRSGRTEEVDSPKAEPIIEDLESRVYYRLTVKGRRAPEMVWLHPLRLYYSPFDWERTQYGDYIKEG